MPKIKGWKKHPDRLTWQVSLNTLLRTQKKRKWVVMGKMSGGYHRVSILEDAGSHAKTLKKKIFKRKKDALAYAISYMKRHPNG